MASYEILKNASLLVDLPEDIIEQGWIVSQGIGYHSGCNPGYIGKVFNLSESQQWTFRYTIQSVETGGINTVIGNQIGPVRTIPGVYEETHTITGSNVMFKFYSTGVNSVSLMQVFPANDASTALTLSFNEDADKWVTYYSYQPEFMLKFINSFFAFRDGGLWEQNVNPIRNNFFGVQYTSKITFYVNLSPTEVKNYFSMRQKSTSPWVSPNDGDIYIYPSEGKPNGQSSRIKKSRFKRLNGDWFADFLRDLNDPRFLTKEEALFKGAELQGNVMKITMENSDTTEVRLLSIDIEVSKQNLTY